LEAVLSKDYVEGLSILGGDPLEIKNIHQVKYIIKECKRYYKLTHDKPLNIWLWTGSIFENLCLLFAEYDEWKDSDAIWYVDDLKYILNNIDVLVDGPFIEEKKDLNLAFRGSSNQRLIDMKKTFENKKLTLLDIKENMRHG
jgi:anaerobic ribonucleoside-triphosphate reductase activating protein